jgi:hypothetical protein
MTLGGRRSLFSSLTQASRYGAFGNMPLFSAGLLKKYWFHAAQLLFKKLSPNSSARSWIYFGGLINWPNLCFYIIDWLIS